MLSNSNWPSDIYFLFVCSFTGPNPQPAGYSLISTADSTKQPITPAVIRQPAPPTEICQISSSLTEPTSGQSTPASELTQRMEVTKSHVTTLRQSTPVLELPERMVVSLFPRPTLRQSTPASELAQTFESPPTAQAAASTRSSSSGVVGGFSDDEIGKFRHKQNSKLIATI